MNARDKNLHARIGEVIRKAQKSAPDDAAFLARLRAGVASMPRAGGAGRALSMTGPKRPKGPRLGDDPRFLANVRQLARKTSNARIVGGAAVVGSEFDDCVAVGSDDAFGCTGTLIAPNAVLTAAHCEALHTRVFIGNNLSKKGRVFRVREHVRHQRFDDQFRNDLMVLILDAAVTGVKPRMLASAALIDAAATGRVVGFGTTDVDASTGFGVKRKTDVPIVSQGCRGAVKGKSDPTVYGCHRDRELVAGKPLLLHDTCKGDSGGPFFIQDAKGQWVLAGVTSRGTDLSQTMCGDGGVYVRIDAYKSWIEAILKANRI